MLPLSKRLYLHPNLAAREATRFRSAREFPWGHTLFASGEIGADLHTREIPKDFEAEVKTYLDNIGIILRAAGMDYSDVVSA